MSTTSSNPQPLTFNATYIEALRARLQGRVLVVGDEGYETMRQLLVLVVAIASQIKRRNVQ